MTRISDPGAGPIAVGAAGHTGLPQVCVGIATIGRPAILAGVLPHLRSQTLPPFRIIVSCVSPDDVAGVPETPNLQIVFGLPGLARQRNAILDHLPDGAAMVAFFDDDFVPHPDWLHAAARRLRDDPGVACVTGHVLADGIKGPGLTIEAALGCIARADGTSGADWTIEGYSPYGCNMAFRRSAIGALRFDERLVLYGWLEDRDLGAAVARQGGGRLIKIGQAQGVHLGAKSGRVSGRRLGYSQMMNPIYMYRKGTMSAGSVIDHLARNFGSNLLRVWAPEPYIDRAGRLRGNCLAFRDMLLGRITPERAAQL